MRRYWQWSIILVALLACIVTPRATQAGTNSVGGITLTTPNTYGSCTATGDTLVATNEAAGIRLLRGQVIVQYVVEAGRIMVPGGFYSVDVTLAPGESYSLDVSYPPASAWPVYSSTNSVRELHVDVQLEVYEVGMYTVLIGPLGYGQDWDVFCHGDPPPPDYRGCTPGYWKNHLRSWPISPALRVNQVFSGPHLIPSLGSSTLKDALRFKGGSTLNDAQQILLRAAVAAYLNASSDSVTYPLTQAQVVDQVSAALHTDERSYVIDTASQLDSFNNLGCPLH